MYRQQSQHKTSSQAAEIPAGTGQSERCRVPLNFPSSPRREGTPGNLMSRLPGTKFCAWHMLPETIDAAVDCTRRRLTSSFFASHIAISSSRSFVLKPDSGIEYDPKITKEPVYMEDLVERVRFVGLCIRLPGLRRARRCPPVVEYNEGGFILHLSCLRQRCLSRNFKAHCDRDDPSLTM